MLWLIEYTLTICLLTIVILYLQPKHALNMYLDIDILILTVLFLFWGVIPQESLDFLDFRKRRF